MYATDEPNRFLEVTYQNGDKEILFFKDFSSGAMIENIVRRSEEARDQAPDRGRRPGDLHPGPARLDQAGVPRARGPAEHDQPRRLGEDLGQEGRADRVRAHAAARGRPEPAAAARSSASPPVSTCRAAVPASRHRRSRATRVDRARATGRLTSWQSRRCAGSRPSTACCSAAPRTRTRCSPRRCSSTRTSSTARSAGTSTTSRPAATPAASAATGAQPPEIETHLVNTVLTNGARYYVDHAHPEYSTPECADALELVVRRQGGGADPRPLDAGGAPAARSGPGDRRLQEQLRRQGQLVRHATRTTWSTAQVPFVSLVRNLLPWFVTRQVFTGAGKVGTENGAAAGRLPDQRPRRLLRGGGRARDHAEASDRQHARRAARRPAEVPAPARDRRRREPLRGRDVPQGRHHRDRARDDRGRLHRQGPRRSSARSHAMRTVSHDPTCRATLELVDGGSCTAVELQWEFLRLAQKYADETGLEVCGGEEVGGDVLRRWEAVLTALERDPMGLDGQLDWVTKLVAARGLPRPRRPRLGRPEARAPRPAVPRRPARAVAVRAPRAGG